MTTRTKGYRRVGYSVDADGRGYTVTTYAAGRPIDTYHAGNHPKHSDGDIRLDPESAPAIGVELLEQWARQTAHELAAEKGIHPLDVFPDEPYEPEEEHEDT